MRHFFRNLFDRDALPTISYPEEDPGYGNLFRGRHKLNLREDGTTKCVACYMCATVCPARCIHIVAEESPDPNIEKRPKVFEIDALRCVMCGLCVDACPCDAIVMTGEYAMAEYSRKDFIWDIEFLTRRPSLKETKPGYTPRI
ncbi:MAG: NADH-quinone oxidoreductase subunit I [Deltaproteobacteria bacterium]|nr:NADH-quinone oxidoreductase subunit I [Deltaproteobacteria bacterium]